LRGDRRDEHHGREAERAERGACDSGFHHGHEILP
jgi:hypothetical protein